MAHGLKRRLCWLAIPMGMALVGCSNGGGGSSVAPLGSSVAAPSSASAKPKMIVIQPQITPAAGYSGRQYVQNTGKSIIKAPASVVATPAKTTFTLPTLWGIKNRASLPPAAPSVEKK